MELSPRAIAPGDRRSGSYGTRHGWQAPCSLRLRSASGPVRGSSSLHRALAAFGSRRSLAGVQAHGSATLLRASRCFCGASVRRPSSVRTTTTGVALARLGQCFFFFLSLIVSGSCFIFFTMSPKSAVRFVFIEPRCCPSASSRRPVRLTLTCFDCRVAPCGPNVIGLFMRDTGTPRPNVLPQGCSPWWCYDRAVACSALPGGSFIGAAGCCNRAAKRRPAAAAGS